MSYSQKDLAESILRLKDNANFKQYVNTLEAQFNARVMMLLDSPHPDEALRGECRALRNLLKNINRSTGDLT